MFPPHSNLTLLIYDDTTIFCIYKINFNRNKNNMKIGGKKWTNFHLMIYEKKMNKKGENIEHLIAHIGLCSPHIYTRTCTHNSTWGLTFFFYKQCSFQEWRNKVTKSFRFHKKKAACCHLFRITLPDQSS